MRGSPLSGSPNPANAGSIPRVRGSHQHLQRRKHGAGSIPACAGEPSRLMRYDALVDRGRVPSPRVREPLFADTHQPDCSERGVHPRVCGANSRSVTIGARAFQPGPSPACAGEPCKGVTTQQAGQATGPSPRVRGSRRQSNAASWRSGLRGPSPRAGALMDERHRAVVHPRVCGGASGA